MTAAPRTYRLAPAAVSRYVRDAMLRALPFQFIPAVALPLVLAPAVHPADRMRFLIMCGLLVIGLVILSMRRWKRTFNSLEYTVTENAIARTQRGMPALEIAFSEVTSVEEHIGKRLEIRTARRWRTIHVFTGTEGYEDLRGRLPFPVRRLSPARTRADMFLTYFGLTVTLMCITVATTSRAALVVVPAGIASVAAMIWAFIAIRRSPNIDLRTKRLSWLALIPMAGLAGRIVLVMRGAI